MLTFSKLIFIVFLLCLVTKSQDGEFPKITFYISDPVILEKCEEGCPEGGDYEHVFRMIWSSEAKTLSKLYKKHTSDCKKVHSILVDYQYLIDDDVMIVEKGPLEIGLPEQDSSPYQGERTIIIAGKLQNAVSLVEELQSIGYEIDIVIPHEKDVEEDGATEEQYVNTYNSIIQKGMERGDALCKTIEKDSEARIVSINEVIPEEETETQIIEETHEDEDEDEEQETDIIEQIEEMGQKDDSEEYITLEFEVECVVDEDEVSARKQQENEYMKSRYRILNDDDEDL